MADPLEIFYGLVSGMLGISHSVIALNLLEANVMDGLGKHLWPSRGSVRRCGRARGAWYCSGSPRRLADVVRGETELGMPTLMAILWTSLDVRDDGPRKVALACRYRERAGHRKIVVPGEGMEEETPTEGIGGAFIR